MKLDYLLVGVELGSWREISRKSMEVCISFCTVTNA